MSEEQQSKGLGPLVDILNKSKRPEGIDDDDTILIEVVEALKESELIYLNSSPLSIASAKDADGNTVRVSTLTGDSAGVTPRSKLKVTVPRDRRGQLVASNFDDFLADGDALFHEPKEYIILDEELEFQPFFSTQEAKGDFDKIRSYRTAKAVVTILQEESDHFSEDSKTVTFFDAERVDIEIGCSAQILKTDFPCDELKEFLSQNGMQTLRKEAFKTTLWDTLKDYGSEERFRRLIEKGRGTSFMRAVNYNFRLAKSDHSLGKRLDSARQEYREIAGNLAKLAAGLEAKAFVLPGTLLLAGRFLNRGEGLTFSNALIALSTIALAVISTVAFKAHCDISEDFSEEIEKVRNNLSDTEEDQKIRSKLKLLDRRFGRIKKMKLSIVIGSWLVALGITVACFWPNQNDTSPEVEGASSAPSSIGTASPVVPTTTTPKVGGPAEAHSEEETILKEQEVPEGDK